MIRRGILFIFASLVICNFCNLDFVSIKRHTWRCKFKIPMGENQRNHRIDITTIDHAVDISRNRSNSYLIKCVCGKECKGLRGLKTHQRTCCTIKSISDELHNDSIENDFIDENNCGEVISESTSELPNLKDGVKLPTASADWELANSYFHNKLPVNEIKEGDLNYLAEQFSTVVYNYFKDSYGFKKNVSREDNEFTVKYKQFSNGQLKSALKKLKSRNAPLNEIQYVSKLLRYKLSNNEKLYTETIDHDIEINKHFWGYCKRFLEKPQRILPSFNAATCFTFFRKSFWCRNMSKIFKIPSWIPQFSEPTVPFNQLAPSYGKISKIINRMKSSGCPCPIDQISIITFKRCPYLRTYITLLISEILEKKRIPDIWRKAVTVLIYKKGDTSDPANFRPITLENICLKILTSLLRDRLYEFLIANKYIENNIQKGFAPKLSGTWEHIAQLSHIINQSRRHQRSITITLLDLRNAFGEVHHNLIETSLEYHHIPSDIREIIKIVYTDFKTCIVTDDYTTPTITVTKGVLQGDCMSPLLFNVVINTFIQYVKKDHFSQLGFKYFQYLLPKHWMQFADDAVAISGQEYENQILLNAFGRWCAWSEMLIRVDKCHTFGIKKVNTAAKQIKPKLYINNKIIPPIESGDSFIYLGRYFNFSMSDKDHETSILNKINDNMAIIDKLPLHPKNKLKIYHRYLLSKISWDLTVAEITQTWLKNNVDNIISSYIRSWLEIPISGNLDGISLGKSKFGFNFIKVSSRAHQCQTTFRNKIAASPNTDIRTIHEKTRHKCNIQYDQYKSTRDVIKNIRMGSENRISQMKTQGLVMKSIWEHSWSKSTNYWHKAVSRLPKNIYSFVTRYLNNTLANGTNTLKWRTSQTSTCGVCGGNETLGHVISGCKVAMEQGRYTWRHDSVLKSIALALSPIVRPSEIFCDCDPLIFKSPSIISGNRYRPDLIIKFQQTKLLILELTVGYETNLKVNFDRKQEKYITLIDELNKTYDVNYVNLSMGSIGTIYKNSSNIKREFIETGLLENDYNHLIAKIIEICIRCSYYIFCMRGKEWEKTELLGW